MLSVKHFIQICAAVCVALLPFAQLKMIVFGMPLYSVEIPVVVALGAYIYGWSRGVFSLDGRANRHLLGVIGGGLFFLGALVSFFANPFSFTGLGMLKTWFVFPLLLAWLFFQTQPDERARKCILNTWLMVTFLAACGALVYVLAGGNLTFDGRLAAWFDSPNYLAIFIAPGIFITFSKLQKFFEEKKEMKNYTFPLFALLVLLVTLFLTHSYGVWLAVFGATFLVIILSAQDSSKKNFWKVLGVVTIVAGTFFFFEHGDAKWQSLMSLQDRSSMASRIMIWQAAGKMISDNPLVGIGLGRFQEVYLEYQKYFPPYLEWAVPQPHNIVLAVWLQTGLLGLIGFVLLVFQVVTLLIKNKSQEAVLLLGLLVLYLIYGVFDTPFFKTDLAFTFWLIIGLVFALPRPEAELQK